ncbi:MAG: metallopeptidase family protein [Elusimicrobia bacterium]|nr:metallopeptidase family protein [Elusimicrobiota bacterium]
MIFEDFEKIVEKSFGNIPEKFKKILEKEHIKIIPREKPPPAIKDRFSGRIVFGVFVGIPYNKRSTFSIAHEPTRIELYKESFERIFSNDEEMKSQIVKTVIHEISHYFGFSEKEIREKI